MEEKRCPRCDWPGLGVFRSGRRLYTLNLGDIIGCRNCGAILIVDKDLSHREPTKEEFKKMRANPEIWKRVVMTMADAVKFLKKDL